MFGELGSLKILDEMPLAALALGDLALVGLVALKSTVNINDF